VTIPIALPDNLILNQAKVIAEFCMKQRMPARSVSGKFADAGDLPVQKPTRFEMGFNLKLARALLRADRVIA
jgi:hypothetical protein